MATTHECSSDLQNGEWLFWNLFNLFLGESVPTVPLHQEVEVEPNLGQRSA